MRPYKIKLTENGIGIYFYDLLLREASAFEWSYIKARAQVNRANDLFEEQIWRAA